MGFWNATQDANLDAEKNNFNMRRGAYDLSQEQYERAGIGTHLKRAVQALPFPRPLGFSGRAGENLSNIGGRLTTHQLKNSPVQSRFFNQFLGSGFMYYGLLHGDSAQDIAGYTLPFAAATLAYSPVREAGMAVGKLAGLGTRGFGGGLGKLLGRGGGGIAALAASGTAYAVSQAFDSNNFLKNAAAKINRGGYISSSGQNDNTMTHRQKMLNKLSKSGLNDRGALLGNEAMLLRRYIMIYFKLCIFSTSEYRMKTEEFIAQSKEKHNDKYTYENTIYVDAKSKISIMCKIHGEFHTTSYRHINRGDGCRECGIIARTLNRSDRISYAKFVEQSNIKHNCRYQYPEQVISTVEDFAKIICTEHGEFSQKVTAHMNTGYGCNKCSYAAKVKSRTNLITYDSFCKKAINTHGDLYIYPTQVINGNETKVTIVCREHGEFTQLASGHLRGLGCPSCSKYAKKDLSHFIQKAKEIHSDKYNYDKFIYGGSNTKGTIVCNEHGEFQQSPNAHIIAEHGCPYCGSGGTYGEWYFNKYPERKDFAAVLYINKMEFNDEQFIKIGITKKDPNKRFKSPTQSGGYKCEVIYNKNMTIFQAWQIEQKILSLYRDFKYEPQLLFAGHTECFKIELEDLIIEKILQLHREI